jgi:hypothetical protein
MKGLKCTNYLCIYNRKQSECWAKEVSLTWSIFSPDGNELVCNHFQQGIPLYEDGGKKKEN